MRATFMYFQALFSSLKISLFKYAFLLSQHFVLSIFIDQNNKSHTNQLSKETFKSMLDVLH